MKKSKLSYQTQKLTDKRIKKKQPKLTDCDSCLSDRSEKGEG